MKKSVIYLQVFARIVSPLITLIVTILSLLPSRSLSQTLTFFPFSDKILHLIAYVAVSATICIALARTNDQWNKRDFLLNNAMRVAITFLIVFFIGFMIEIVQPLFNREKEILDLVFNSIGAITGIIVGMGFLMIIQRSGNGNKDI